MSVKRDVNNFAKNLEATYKDQLKKRQLLFLANQSIEEIKVRSRAGFGVAKTGGIKRKFDRLSPNYIEQRRRIRLSPFTRPAKSNVTRSGRMLASLRAKVKSKRRSEGTVLITPTGVSREGIPNAKVAEFVQAQGRVFLNLSRAEINKLAVALERALSRGLKKL